MKLSDRTRNFLVLSGIGLFFFAVPLASVAYFWNDAHAKMKTNAVAYAAKTALPLLKDWDPDRMFAETSIEGRKAVTAEAVAQYRAQYGKLVQAGEPRATAIKVGERDDHAWQLTTVEADGTFEKGKAKVKLLVAHRTTSLVWQIEGLTLSPLP